MSKSMGLRINWSIFSKNRNAIYGVSILSIMVFHFFEDVLTSNLPGRLHFVGKVYNTLIGSVGVEWFVFLSGVGLYFSLKKDSNVKNYFEKRIKRILPTYVAVALIYWFIVDISLMKIGINCFLSDFFFITFFTRGTRTFWYVLFILVAYSVYPLIYRLLELQVDERAQLLMLATGALTIQFIPRLLAGSLYSNIEILLGRFLIFFIGCWCGRKIYRTDDVSIYDQMGFLFGTLWMIGFLVPGIQSIVSKFGYRILMCFWGIFLLYVVILVLERTPVSIRKCLEYFGSLSYELYLTHVAMRAFMNATDLKTYYIQNYILCIAISIVLSIGIRRVQRRKLHEV